MKTGNLTQEEMRKLGKDLAENTPVMAFNEMVGRILKHGHMFDNPGEGKTYFIEEVVTVNNILALVQSTLAEPDSVHAKGKTRILYRKEQGEQIGAEQSNGAARSVLGVLIDLDQVPDGTNLLDAPPEALDKVGWIVAYPTT